MLKKLKMEADTYGVMQKTIQVQWLKESIWRE